MPKGDEGKVPVKPAKPADFRALIAQGFRAKPRTVVLPDAPPLRTGDELLIPRLAGAPPLADLSGVPKLLIAQGPQNSGKTFDMRMIASEAEEAGRLERIFFGALDQGTRSLRLFVEGVAEPASTSDADTLAMVEAAHELMVQGGEARPDLLILDCGGNNRAVAQAVTANPKFVAQVEAAGAAVILAYYFVPRTMDLTLLEQHWNTGLRSRHTLLTMNLAKAAHGLTSFDTMREQPAWRRLVEAGAAETVLPVLSEVWSQQVEDNRLPFWMARDGKVPEGLDSEPLSERGSVAVAGYLHQWRTARRPVKSWLS